MSKKFVLVDLDKQQKSIVLEKASFFVQDAETKEDLNNNRKKWIRFRCVVLPDLIGELSYYCNRSSGKYEAMLLDELITHLEWYERHAE